MPLRPLQRELFALRPAPAGINAAPHATREIPAGVACVRALRRHGWWLAVVLILSLAAGTAYARWALPVYRAAATLVSEPATALVHFPNDLPLTPPVPDDAAQTLAELLGSRVAVARALHEFPPIAAALPPPEEAMRQLRVAVVPSTTTLTLQFDGSHPAFAAGMLRALLIAAARQDADATQASRLAGLRLLAGRVATARADAADAAADAAAVAARYGLTDPAQQLSLANLRWQQLASSETSADIAALAQEAALASGSLHVNAQDGDDAAIAGDPVTLRLQRAQAAAEVNRLAAIYRPQAAPLVQARQQLASLDANLAELHQQAQDQRQRSLAAARRQSADLASTLASAARRQSQLQQANHAWDLANRSLDADQTVYSNLLDQLQQATAEQDDIAPPFRVLDPPFAAPVPVHPRLLEALASALVLGLGLGALLLWGLEHAHDTLSSVEASELGVPLVAVLPRARTPLTDRGFASGVSAAATALLRARADAAVQVVVMAGVAGGEGKTTCVLALARQLASVSPRGVLVLDVHGERPALHRHLNGPLSPGLSDVLAEQVPIADALRTDAGPPGITYVSAGSPAAGPALTLLLAAGAASNFLAAARPRYDWILMDAGSALDHSETLLWAAASDLAVLVAAAGRSSRGASRLALARLASSGASRVALLLSYASPRTARAPTVVNWDAASASAGPSPLPSETVVPLRQTA